MEITVVGLNHKTAPVEVREKLSFTARDYAEALAELAAIPGFSEGLILSTCNRTEIYSAAQDAAAAHRFVVDYLSEFHQVPREDFVEHLYHYRGSEAVRHLFLVACGLDAMILGETQILGQVKEAYLTAAQHHTVGKLLHNLFGRALRVGKRAHTETVISQNAVSVSYAAVELAKKVFQDLKGRKVLVIGAGKMSELTVRHLVDSGVDQVIVANRTYERAEKLAALFHGKAVEFERIEDWLKRVDVVISSTGAPHLILKKDVLAGVMRARRGRPIFLFDIAVPRDIDPRCQQIGGVFLYDIDDLETVVKANLKERQREAVKIERMIQEEVADFERWLNTLEVIPVIRSLREKAEEIRCLELERALRKLPELDARQRKVVEAMGKRIVNKILNDPTVKIKEYAHGADGGVYLKALRKLFNLETKSSQGGEGSEEEYLYVK